MRNAIKRVLTETWDSSSGALKQEITLSVRAELLQGSFIQKLGGPKHFVVLMVILAHSNATGESFPSQERIAKIVGMTRDTVRKIINDLLEVEIDGKYLLSREQNTEGKYVNHVYSYLAKPFTEDSSREYKNGLDVLKRFMTLYEDEFGDPYMPHYKRDAGMFRDKLLKVYSDEQINAILTIGVGQFKERWANKAYPRPTVSMICGWVANSALAIWEAQSKEELQVQERMEVDMDAEAEALLALMGGN